MYRIRYFIEDYWKWLLVGLISLGVIFTVIILSGDGNNDKASENKVVDVVKEDDKSLENNVDVSGKESESKVDEKDVIPSDDKEDVLEGHEYTSGVNFKESPPKLDEADRVVYKYKGLENKYDVSSYVTDLGAYVVAPFYYESLDKKISCVNDNNENIDNCLTYILNSGEYDKYNSKDKGLVKVVSSIEEEYKLRLGYAKSIASDDTINISKDELLRYKESINRVVLSSALKLDVITRYKKGGGIVEVKKEFSEAKVLGDSAEEYFYNSFIRGGDN